VEFHPGVVWVSILIHTINHPVIYASKMQWLSATLHNAAWTDRCQIHYWQFKVIPIQDHLNDQKGFWLLCNPLSLSAISCSIRWMVLLNLQLSIQLSGRKTFTLGWRLCHRSCPSNTLKFLQLRVWFSVACGSLSISGNWDCLGSATTQWI